jgi:hypothetical protein
MLRCMLAETALTAVTDTACCAACLATCLLALLQHPNMLWQNLETNMKPKAAWFKERLSIDGAAHGRLIARCPPIMSFSPEKLDEKVSLHMTLQNAMFHYYCYNFSLLIVHRFTVCTVSRKLCVQQSTSVTVLQACADATALYSAGCAPVVLSQLTTTAEAVVCFRYVQCNAVMSHLECY